MGPGGRALVVQEKQQNFRSECQSTVRAEEDGRRKSDATGNQTSMEYFEEGESPRSFSAHKERRQ